MPCPVTALCGGALGSAMLDGRLLWFETFGESAPGVCTNRPCRAKSVHRTGLGEGGPLLVGVVSEYPRRRLLPGIIVLTAGDKW
jgi:hypothetical protein